MFQACATHGLYIAIIIFIFIFRGPFHFQVLGRRYGIILWDASFTSVSITVNLILLVLIFKFCSMKKVSLVAGCWLLVIGLNAQKVKDKIQKAYQKFESDSQLKHAINSLYVINAKTGEVVFDKNSQVGLAAASTQKIITATTAFELLGKDYRYKTELGYNGKIENGILKGNLFIVGGGDPTLGSWRYPTTIDTVILKNWLTGVRKLKIKKIDGDIAGVDDKFESQTT